MNAILKRFLPFFLFYSANLICSETKEWNFYLYMEPNAALHQSAFKNINQIITSCPDNVNVFAFFHGYDDEVFIYKFEKNNINILDIVPWKASISETIIDSMTEIENNFPAQKHSFIFWGHGYGILDPVYDPEKEGWVVKQDGPNCSTCLFKDFSLQKGILVNNEKQVFVNNSEMVHLLKRISSEVLKGKKIDICGMDCCKGAMVEHAYQLRSYINFLIASQECELADGWPYHLIMQKINAPGISAQQLSKCIVDAYKEYYTIHSEEEIYTVSAINVSLINRLKNQIDQFIKEIDLDNPLVVKAVKSAREKCRKFCDAPMYADLYNFCFNVSNELKSIGILSRAIEEQLLRIRKLIKRIVIANATGEKIKPDAVGVSIYFPRFILDESYIPAAFAKHSAWLSFLKKTIQEPTIDGA